MKVSVLSVFPELYSSFLQTSLIKRAQEKKIVSIDVDTLFSFVEPKKRIDAPTFGHGTGMVLKPDVMQRAIESTEKKSGKAFKIFFSPQGNKLDQHLLKKLANKLQEQKHIMLLPARYEGMDARVEQEYADEIISVGDFVLMGGDIPAMTLLEGLLRLVPGVVGKKASVTDDSFYGPFVDYQEFCAPVEWKGHAVPEVIRSGNHQAVTAWREQQAVRNTVLKHFEWLRQYPLTIEHKQKARLAIPNHYVVLEHGDVMVGADKKKGPTTVTSIDIHDIGRSCATYGIENFFIVTPLLDQQKIVQKIVGHWTTSTAQQSSTRNRYAGINKVAINSTIDEVVNAIEEKEGEKPLFVATSAQVAGQDKVITFFDQQKVWKHDRPVLIVFGTGQGLTHEFLDRCDYVLVPVNGLTDFNHLSVRSAAAIVLDRWLGISPKNR